MPAEGVFVGVTFEIEALSDPINASPIVTTGSGTDIDNSLWVRTAVRIPNWTDAANKGFGRAAIQVLSEGAIPENALDAKDFDPVYMKPGKRTIVPVTATMAGTKQVNSLAFTMKVGNHEPSKEQTVDLPQPLTLFGQELQLNIPVNAPTQSGEYPVEVTITKVNGEANGSPHATSKGAFCRTGERDCAQRCRRRIHRHRLRLVSARHCRNDEAARYFRRPLYRYRHPPL